VNTEYRREYMRRWRDENRKRTNELAREYYARNRAAILLKEKDRHRKKLYGLSPEQWALMVVSQGGCCAICREEKKLHVDHDHATGRVRGLLCNRCNTGLRVLEEPKRLQASRDYLART